MLIKIDAAGLEWRTLVWLANDPVGIEEINSGQDIHGNNQRYFRFPDGDVGRLTAKRFLFRTIYRGSGWAFANDNDFSPISSDPDYWDHLSEQFFKKYKGIDKCHKEWGQTVAAGRPIVSPLGREWLISLVEKEVYDKTTKTKKKIKVLPWPTLTNYPVQGTGADIVKIARILIHRRIKERKLSALLVSTVHDDIKIDCPEEEVFEVAKLAEEAYQDVSKNIERMWGIKVPIPFLGEVKVGKDLKNMVKMCEFST